MLSCRRMIELGLVVWCLSQNQWAGGNLNGAGGTGDPADCVHGVVCGTVPHAGFAAAQDDKFVCD